MLEPGRVSPPSVSFAVFGGICKQRPAAEDYSPQGCPEPSQSRWKSLQWQLSSSAYFLLSVFLHFRFPKREICLPLIPLGRMS